MTLPRRAERLMIYLEETEHQRRIPSYVEIVERARRMDMAGATVLEAVEGFGRSAHVHRRHRFAVKADLPVVVTIIDTPGRIDRFLEEMEPLLARAVVVRQPVEIAIHRGGDWAGSEP